MSSPQPVLWHRHDRADAIEVQLTEARVHNEDRIKALGQQLFEAAAQAQGRPLIVRMDQVEYISSHLIAKLLAVHQRLHAVGGKLILMDVKPRIFAALRTANLDKVLDVRALPEDGWRPKGGTASNSDTTMSLE